MKSMLRAIIRKYLPLLLSLSLTASLGFALTEGLSSGYHGLERTLDRYLSDYGYPDGVITTDVTSVSDAEKIQRIKGVASVDTSLCADTMLRKEDGEYLAVRIFSYADTDRQKFYFWEHADSGGENSVLLEYHYARSHHIKAGDTVSFRVRDEYRPFFVAGIISRPETLYTKFSEHAWGLNYDFGYAYVERKLLAREYENEHQENKDQLDEKADQLQKERKKAERLLKEKEKELEDAKKLLAKKTSLYKNKQRLAKNVKARLARTREKLDETADKLETQEARLASAIKEAKSVKRKLKEERDSLVQAKKALSDIDEATALVKSLQKYLQKLENDGTIDYLKTLPPDTLLKDVFDIPESYRTMVRELANLDAYDIDDPQLKELIQMLEKAFINYDDLTVGEVLNLYDKILAMIPKALDALKEARAEIVAKLEESGIREDEIDTLIRKLEQAIGEADRTISGLEENQEKLKQSSDKARSAIKQIDSKVQEIDRKLLHAGEQLDDARSRISRGESALRQTTAEKLEEFAHMEDKLDRAYSKLDKNEGYDQLCNTFLLYMDDGADPQQILALACDTFDDDVKVKSCYTYDDSPVKERIDQNLDPIHVLTVYCPVIFYLITLGIVFMFMSTIIRQSRYDIGVLRGLGFRKGWIRTVFCTVSIAVALAGILIGCAIGFGLMRYISGYFEKFFPLPFFDYGIDWRMSLIGAGATVCVCLTAALITTRSISSVMPTEAMSRQILTRARIPDWAERLTRRLRPMTKFSLTSLLRNKGRFVFSSICIAASVMLIFSSMSFIASKNYTITQVFDERIHYDSQIFLDDAPDDELLEQLNELDYVSDAQPLLYYEAEISSADRSETAVINAVTSGTSLITIPETYNASDGADSWRTDGFDTDAGGAGGEETGLSVRTGEIILDSHLASDLGVHAGDTVYVNGSAMTVGSVSEQCANRIEYITLEDADLLGTPDLGCVICDLSDGSEQDLLRFLMDSNIDGYLYTMFMKAFFHYNKELYDTYDTAAHILIWFAVLLGFVIILNTAMTNLQDTRRELCVLRSLGFHRREISRSRFSQTVLQFLVSCPVGLAAGILFTKKMLLMISSEGDEYIMASGPREYIITVLIVFAYLTLSHLAAMRSLRRWDITAVIKEKE